MALQTFPQGVTAGLPSSFLDLPGVFLTFLGFSTSVIIADGGTRSLASASICFRFRTIRGAAPIHSLIRVYPHNPCLSVSIRGSLFPPTGTPRGATAGLPSSASLWPSRGDSLSPKLLSPRSMFHGRVLQPVLLGPQERFCQTHRRHLQKRFSGNGRFYLAGKLWPSCRWFTRWAEI